MKAKTTSTTSTRFCSLIVGALFMVFSRCVVDAAFDCSLSDPTELESGLFLRHLLNLQDGTFTIELTYQGGPTWLGIGRSSDGGMVGSDVVIGRLDIDQSDSNPGKYHLSSTSSSGVNLKNNQNLLNASIVMDSNGDTVLTFTSYLDEFGDYSVTRGSADTWVYAVGSTSGDDSFPKQHELQGSIDVEMALCVWLSPSPTDLMDTSVPTMPVAGPITSSSPSTAPRPQTTPPPTTNNNSPPSSSPPPSTSTNVNESPNNQAPADDQNGSNSSGDYAAIATTITTIAAMICSTVWML